MASGAARRPRPVITVVEARPMEQVGFRGPAAGNSQPENPKPQSAAAASSSESAEVQRRKPPQRPGVPPARPPSFRKSMPPESDITSTQAPPEPAKRPQGAPVPAPRTSLGTRPASVHGTVTGGSGPPKPARASTDVNVTDTSTRGDFLGVDNVGFDQGGVSGGGTEAHGAQGQHEELLIDFSSDVTTKDFVYTQMSDKNSATSMDSEPVAPLVPAKSVHSQVKQDTTAQGEKNPVTNQGSALHNMGAQATPLAFVNRDSHGLPKLKPTVHVSAAETAHASPDKLQGSEVNSSSEKSPNSGNVRKKVFPEGIPVLPMGPGPSRMRPKSENFSDSTKPHHHMGPPPSTKPKPGLKPKPAIKPKPAVKPKPGSFSTPTSPTETENPVAKSVSSMNLNATANTKPVVRPKSMIGLPTSSVEATNTESEQSVSSIMSAMKARLEEPPVKSQADDTTSGKSKPMKATYRPTIIRPQASKPTETMQDPESSGAAKNHQVSADSKPEMTRNRPTIIRPKSTVTPSTDEVTTVEPQRPQMNAFQSELGQRLGVAVSMPNLAQKKNTDAHNWDVRERDRHDESENVINEILETEHTQTNFPRKSTSMQFPPSTAPHPIMPHQDQGQERGHGQGHPESPPPSYEASEIDKVFGIDGKVTTSKPPPKPQPPRPSAAPKDGKPPRESAKSMPPPRPSAGPPRNRTSSKEKGPAPSLPTRPGPGHPLFHYVVSEPHGIAIYDYESTHHDELSFKAGDVVVLVNRVNDQWLLGRLVDKEGIFPANFIDIVQDLPADQSNIMTRPVRSPSSPHQKHVDTGSGPRCLARFDYESPEPGDLSFTSDEVIKLVGHEGEEWLKGELNGKVGMFPASYVEIIEDLSPEDVAQDDEESENTVTAIKDHIGKKEDLSFLSGARIKVVGRVNAKWLRGEIAGHQGNFPAEYVDRVPENLPQAPGGEVEGSPEKLVQGVTAPAVSNAESDYPKSDGTHGYCVAQHDYQGESPDDLAFTKGDNIQLLAHINAEWLKGSLRGKTGMFPRAFVDIIKDIDELPPRPGFKMSEPDSSSLPSQQTTPHARAIFDYASEEESDLSLKVGDEITLLERVGDDWLKGKIENRVGMFPAAFVEVIVPL